MLGSFFSSKEEDVELKPMIAMDKNQKSMPLKANHDVM
jgi:hypothetical protein